MELPCMKINTKINLIFFFLVIWSKNKEAISPLLRADGIRLTDVSENMGLSNCYYVSILSVKEVTLYIPKHNVQYNST